MSVWDLGFSKTQDFTSAVAGHHVTAPVQKLFGDLDALRPTQGAFVCPIQWKFFVGSFSSYERIDNMNSVQL